VNPVRKQRLYIVLFIIFFSSSAIGLVAYALRGNINHFYPPAEVAAGKAPIGKSIRVGGMVVAGSIVRSTSSLAVTFELTDYASTVKVAYEGILPDLFDEEQGAVAAGVLNDAGLLEATEVLAKHDENYMPPEVADALKKSGYDDTGKSL